MKHDGARERKQKHVISYSVSATKNKSFKMSTLMDDKFESIFSNIRKKRYTHGSRRKTSRTNMCQRASDPICQNKKGKEQSAASFADRVTNRLANHALRVYACHEWPTTRRGASENFPAERQSATCAYCKSALRDEEKDEVNT